MLSSDRRDEVIMEECCFGNGAANMARSPEDLIRISGSASEKCM